VGIVRIFMAIEASKIGVWVAVNVKMSGGAKNETFTTSSFQVTPDTLEGSNMFGSGTESVAGALADGKGNVRAGVAGKVEKHADNAGVVEGRICWGAGGVFGESSSFSRGVFGGGVGGIKAKGRDDTVSKTTLSEMESIVVGCDINTKEAFSGAFCANPDLVLLKGLNQFINLCRIASVEEEIVNIGHYNDILSNKQAGVEIGLFQPLSFESAGKIPEEVSGSLFETIE
jgi:hypothetical protein